MTRRMFDSIRATSCPPGADLYAGYVDGNVDWRSYRPLCLRFPGKRVVSITITASNDTAELLDVEVGDATPAQAPDWARRRRARGAIPNVYCNAATWPAVRAAFAAQGVAQPQYVIAAYGSDRSIPAGAVAHQWVDHGLYDESTVADYWPGIDPAPTAPTTHGGTMYRPPLAMEPWVASLKDPASKGVWGVSADGDVYAIEGAPFRNWPTQHVDFAGRTVDHLELPDASRGEDVDGHAYVIVSTDGHRYVP